MTASASVKDPARLRSLDTAQLRQIVLALPQLDAVENLSWQNRLRRGAAACGCGEGTAGLLLGLALYGASIYFAGLPADLLARVLGGIAIAIASLSLGKAVGLQLAKRRERALVRELAALAAARTLASAGLAQAAHSELQVVEAGTLVGG